MVWNLKFWGCMTVAFALLALLIGASPLQNAGVGGPGSSTANAVARWADTSGIRLVSSGVIIDDTDHLITPTNVGTTGVGVTVIEYGTAFHHLTRLDMGMGVLSDIAGGVNEAEGLLIYTFPAGVVLVDVVHMDVGITQTEGFINADTPDVGVGSVIATGAVAVLGGTATFEDYVTGTAAANCTGTVTDSSTEATAGGARLLQAGDAHTVHFNAGGPVGGER